MGRNKPRSKAVDVTKRLLQPTSVTDHIAVQISPNVVVQVAEEDLSPTQGSEAAFALRREGKLDTTMKLCLNWRQGNCHNHAACSFAHIVRYFGVTSDLLSPVATGRSNIFGTTACGGTHSSMTVGTASIRGSTGGAAVGASGSNSNGGSTSWSQKVSPPSYSAVANKGAPPASAATITTASTPALATGEVREAKTATPPAPASVAAYAEEAKENKGAPPTPASTAAATPNVRPAATPAVPAAGVPAQSVVLSADGLRSILISLSATVAATTVAKPTTTAAAADGEAETGTAAKNPGSGKAVERPLEFLSRLAAAPVPETSCVRWEHRSYRDHDEIVDTVGKHFLGEIFSVSKKPVDCFNEQLALLPRRPAHVSSVLSRYHCEASCSPNTECLAAAMQTAPAGDYFFSTAPTTSPSHVDVLRDRDNYIGSNSKKLRSGGLVNDSDVSLPGLSYQDLMNMFAPEE